MKSIKFLATALSLSALLFSACTQDTLEVGIDGNKPGITNLVLGEVTHASKSVTLSWSASSAVNAGAASFTVQFLENKDTTDGKLLKPDMYDATIAKTVDVTRDENGNATATDYTATIDGQKVGSKYYIRVRVNYPMSVYSDWTWLTDANGNIAYYKVGRGTVTEGLEDPYLYKVTGTSTGLIVKWDEIPGALSYQIEYKASSASSWESATVNAGEATVYKINGLASSTSYDVRALTNYSAGKSDYCTTQTVSTRAPGSFKKEMGTAQELVDWLEGGVVEVGSSDVFSITADIDLTGISYTAMDESMIGTFDGKGHTIKGVSSPLFYEIETTGVLKNFTAEGEIASSDDNVAAIALTNKGTIQDVTSKVTINYTVTSTNTMLLAGIVAENSGTVTGVTNQGNVTATASAALEVPVIAGGIAAHSTGTLTDVHNEGAVALKASKTIYAVSVAGIVGYLEGPVTNSDNKGAVSISALTPNGKGTLLSTSSATPAVAGIAGYGNTDAFAITNCTNDGPVTYDLSGIDKYTAANYNRTQVGGIVANPYGLVKDCTNNGAITINLKTTSGNALTGSGHEHIICAGGIGGGDYFAGADQNLTSYDGCINNGNITADVASAQSNSAIGGIVGWPGKEASRSNKTTNCTNNGDITLLGPGKVRCGGIHGGSGAISNCKNTGAITANNGTACAIGGISGFSSNGLKITGVRNEGDVISRASGIYVGGLIGNVGNSAGTGDWTGGSSVACTVSSVDTDQTIVGMLVGYWNGTSAAVTVGKADDPVLVTGIYNGTKLTAGNFSNYLAGTNNSAAIHEIYASFDPTPYESEGGGEAETPALDAPSNVTVAVFYNYTTVSWDAVNGAEWYVVEYQKSGENWTPCPKTENTSYDIYGLDHGAAYKFRVKAYASTGSGYSEEKDGETLPEVNLSAPVISSLTPESTSIEVVWAAVENATGYKVEYKKTADTDWTVASENVTASPYSITGLSPETAYDVRLLTLGAGGNVSASYSETASTTTLEISFSYPLTITSADDFVKWLGTAAPVCSATDQITLGADIDLAGKTITPASSFAGIFDGGGKSLKNLTISEPLFTVNTGTVKNVVIASTTGITFGTSGNKAILVGNNQGTVSGCVNNASVNMTENFTDASSTGLLVAVSSGVVKDCTNNGNLIITMASATGAQLIGGVLGSYSTEKGSVAVENCTNTGKVSVIYSGTPKNSYIGGVVGGTDDVHKASAAVFRGSVKECKNSGALEFKIGTPNTGTYLDLGGVAGYLEADIESCSNSGSISVLNEEVEANCTRPAAGGVAGFVLGNAKDCFNTGTLDYNGNFAAGTSDAAGAGGSHQPLFGGVFGGVGAVANAIDADHTMQGCYNTGTMTVSIRQKANGKTRSQLGGVAGYCGVVASGCYNTGALTFKPLSYQSSIGGVIGESKTDLNNCYNDGVITIDGRGNSDLVTGDTNTNKYGTQFYMGGVVGYALAGSTLSLCENKKEIKYTNGWCKTVLSYLGGIMGSYTGGMTMTDCTNSGAVTWESPSAAMVGGLAGAFNGTMSTSVNSGKVSVSKATFDTGKVSEIGGLVGYANAVFKDNQSNGEISNTAENTVTGAFIGGFGADARTFEGNSVNAAVTATTPAALGAVLGWFRNAGASGITVGTADKKFVIKNGTKLNGAAVTADNLLGDSTNGTLDTTNVTIE